MLSLKVQLAQNDQANACKIETKIKRLNMYIFDENMESHGLDSMMFVLRGSVGMLLSRKTIWLTAQCA